MEEIQQRIAHVEHKTFEISRRHRKHIREVKGRKRIIRRTSKWIKKNPLRGFALVGGGIIVYISFLFYNYQEEVLKTKEVISNNKTEGYTDSKAVKGIIIPDNVLRELKNISIDFGKTSISASLEELKRGVEISPMLAMNCENDAKMSDPTKFIISFFKGRLYVNANFKYILNDSLIGSVNQKGWTFFNKNISSFRSDDYSFEVTDDRQNVIYSMQLIKPGTLSIQGYFVGNECIYVVNTNGVYSDKKSGDYIQRAMLEINKIKKLL